ncbi:MAG: Asp23/Gls24 family envelope stress response protein [Clostridiales bacterium]|nr:Asp23/Gls24 family envelope stress response protein [Clostridiales bacterium]
MSVNSNIESIKGDRSMTQGFVAQYAAEAALQIDGVYELKPSFAVALKEKSGVVHEGKGVRVVFGDSGKENVSITVYPIIYYGMVIPEVAWSIQEKVKKDVERFTGLDVESVDVYVCGIKDSEDKLEGGEKIV